MFVHRPIRKRLAGSRHASFGRIHRRVQARFQLEGLEDRCLLSGISSITEFPAAAGTYFDPSDIEEIAFTPQVLYVASP